MKVPPLPRRIPGVLVVIGVNEARQRQVLALQAGDKESAPAWKAVFADLVRRGLDPSTIQLGIMDGLPGLEKAFRAATGPWRKVNCRPSTRCCGH